MIDWIKIKASLKNTLTYFGDKTSVLKMSYDR